MAFSIIQIGEQICHMDILDGDQQVIDWGLCKGRSPFKGETVLVGENGPELFEADTAGTVHPHEKTKALFNQGSPSVNFSPNITINVGNNSDKSVVGDIKGL